MNINAIDLCIGKISSSSLIFQFPSLAHTQAFLYNYDYFRIVMHNPPFVTFFLFLRMFWLEIKTQGLAIFCGENVCLYSSVNSLCSRRIWFPHFWGLPWAQRLKFWVKFVELCACGSARISFQFINKPSCTLQSPYTHFLDINMGGAFYSVSTVHPSIAEWKNCCREIARASLIAIEIWGEGQLQSRTSLESIFVLFVWRG